MLLIEALDCEGESYRDLVRCSQDAGAPDELAIVCDAGRVLREVPSDPPIVLEVERAVIGGDVLRVTGWAIARSPLVSIQVAAGDDVTLAAHGQRRNDIAHDYLRYPDAGTSGFTAEVPLMNRQSPTEITISVASQQGAIYQGVFPAASDESAASNPAALVPESQATEAITEPAAVVFIEYPSNENGIAWLDERRTVVLHGWAVAREGIGDINVYVDDRHVGRATYGSARPDVAEVFPEWEKAANSGFRIRIDAKHFLRNPASIRVELSLPLGRTVNREIRLQFGNSQSRPANNETKPHELMSDITIWRFARTLKMFNPDGMEKRFDEMEAEAGLRNDAAKLANIKKIRTAVRILNEAWSGQPINEKVAQYLRRHGYLPSSRASGDA